MAEFNAKEGLEEATVILYKEAFASMIGDALKHYKKEACGFLFGAKRNGCFRVKHSHPAYILDKDRKYTEVSYRVESGEKFRLGLLEAILQCQIIGDYHSHTDYMGQTALVGLSDDDPKTMEKGRIYFVLALRKKKKEHAWKRTKKKIVCGTIGEVHVQMAAYYFNNKTERFELCTVLCRGIV
ncbi:Mov34/MPN/PAD-1 family protein [archaeon]|nr:Mov34/MPN/PAD-1 family protein [archaeon]